MRMVDFELGDMSLPCMSEILEALLGEAMRHEALSSIAADVSFRAEHTEQARNLRMAAAMLQHNEVGGDSHVG